jgi:hypothetical protein
MLPSYSLRATLYYCHYFVMPSQSQNHVQEAEFTSFIILILNNLKQVEQSDSDNVMQKQSTGNTLTQMLHALAHNGPIGHWVDIMEAKM